MPKRRKNEEIRCRYFRWLLGRRKAVYFADGRSNTPPLGRHSLGTRNRDEALDALYELDLTMAVQHGRADRALLQASTELVEFEQGRTIYEQYVNRPAVAGGPRRSTAKRYRAVLDKFGRFLSTRGLRYWNEVDRKVLDAYAGWLDGESYAYATEYLELTTLKQILKHLVDNDHLPASTLFSYPLRKPDGTDTYCWQPEEVEAIIAHCNTTELKWLHDVVIALASTGMRISELASLRWTDIDVKAGMITLADEGTRKGKAGVPRRTTKSGHSRSFPIHKSLLPVLTAMDHASDGLVFHGPLGGRIKTDTVRRILIRDVLTPLAEKFPSPPDQLGFIDGRLHSFRHFFCSTCANAGIAEQVLMNWLGHRSSKMVRHYYHLHDQESHRQMERVELFMTKRAGVA